MTDKALAIFTVVISTVIIGFTVSMFMVFSKFLNKEKEAAERFRAEHGKKKNE
jgi:hypothetical protein